MGIEPTSHDSRRDSTDFEDQAHHQTGRTSLFHPATDCCEGRVSQAVDFYLLI